MAETIKILGHEEKDWDGNIVRISDPRIIEGCVSDTAGQVKINDQDVSDGDTTTVRVLAPGGSDIREGELVEWRGAEFRVKHVPFDYSVGRRPAVARHRPRLLVILERSEG